MKEEKEGQEEKKEKEVVEAEEQVSDPTGRRQFIKTTIAAAATGLAIAGSAGSGIEEAQAQDCPPPAQLNLVLGRGLRDLRAVKIPGLAKPFEELTITELVQLRPGGDVQDTYEVNAVTDNISVTTSALLNELGKIRKISEMQSEIVVNKIRSGLTQ